jgi:hypothetical protein
MSHIFRLSNYRTMAIGLLFFSAICLSEYQISDWRIQETIGSRPQSIGLSDIRLRKNYQLPTSAYSQSTTGSADFRCAAEFVVAAASSNQCPLPKSNVESSPQTVTANRKSAKLQTN